MNSQLNNSIIHCFFYSKMKTIKKQKCKFCEFTGRSENVRRHEETHVERTPFVCECGTKTSTKGALTRHQTFSCRLKEEKKAISSEVPNQTPSTIALDDFVKLEYVMTLKDGSTIRIPGLVEDIPKLLFPTQGIILNSILFKSVKCKQKLK